MAALRCRPARDLVRPAAIALIVLGSIGGLVAVVFPLAAAGSPSPSYQVVLVDRLGGTLAWRVDVLESNYVVVLPRVATPIRVPWSQIERAFAPIVDAIKYVVLLDWLIGRAEAADRFLVLGDADCTVTAIATDGGCWASTSGGSDIAGVPGAADAMKLDANSGAGTGTMDAALTVGSVDMTGFTGTLAFGANNLTSNGAVTVRSAITGSGTLTVNGAFSNTSVNFGSGVGVVFASNGTITTCGDDNTCRFNGMTVNVSVTMTLASTIRANTFTINGTVTGLFDMNAVTTGTPLAIGGSGSISGIATFNYVVGPANILGTTYGQGLRVFSSGTQLGAITVGSTGVRFDSTYDTGGFGITTTGPFTVSGGTLNLAASQISVGGNWSTAGASPTNQFSTVTLTGAGTIAGSSAGGNDFYNLVINAAITRTYTTALDITNNVTINGTLEAGSPHDPALTFSVYGLFDTDGTFVSLGIGADVDNAGRFRYIYSGTTAYVQPATYETLQLLSDGDRTYRLAGDVSTTSCGNVTNCSILISGWSVGNRITFFTDNFALTAGGTLWVGDEGTRHAIFYAGSSTITASGGFDVVGGTGTEVYLETATLNLSRTATGGGFEIQAFSMEYGPNDLYAGSSTVTVNGNIHLNDFPTGRHGLHLQESTWILVATTYTVDCHLSGISQCGYVYVEDTEDFIDLGSASLTVPGEWINNSTSSSWSPGVQSTVLLTPPFSGTSATVNFLGGSAPYEFWDLTIRGASSSGVAITGTDRLRVQNNLVIGDSSAATALVIGGVTCGCLYEEPGGIVSSSDIVREIESCGGGPPGAPNPITFSCTTQYILPFRYEIRCVPDATPDRTDFEWYVEDELVSKQTVLLRTVDNSQPLQWSVVVKVTLNAIYLSITPAQVGTFTRHVVLDFRPNLLPWGFLLALVFIVIAILSRPIVVRRRVIARTRDGGRAAIRTKRAHAKLHARGIAHTHGEARADGSVRRRRHFGGAR